LKMNTTAMRVLVRYFSGLWFALLSLTSHALTLGSLTVSSSESPSFTASLPFSDDNPVRLPELQTRLASDSEYAQWGLSVPPVARELRVRVVPASQTVGYVELYSLTPLSQNNFDLLVWASYSGQTVLTHYKVYLQPVPSLIKGKTLSTSQGFSPLWRPPIAVQRYAAEKPKKSVQPSKLPVVTELPLPDGQKTQDSPPMESIRTSAPEAPPPHLGQMSNPAPLTAAVNGTMAPPPPASATTDHALGMGGLLLVFSLVLFLFGFLVGRQRNEQTNHNKPLNSARRVTGPAVNFVAPQRIHPIRNSHASTMKSRAEKKPTTGHFSAMPFIQPQAIVTPVPPPSFAPPTDTARPPNAIIDRPDPSPAIVETEPTIAPKVLAEPVTQPLPEIRSAKPVDMTDVMPVAAPPPNPVTSMAVVARTPATALPTPGFAQVSGRQRKPGKTKSAGDSNIDLAKIYLSMGDPATAQMVLQQVMEQGTEAEKAVAEQLMQEMA
jgi:FimV-like protein